MTPGADRPDGDGPPASPTPAPPTRRLSLSDPLNAPASEDRPESWGDPGETEDDILAHYRTQRPPHHGG